MTRLLTLLLASLALTACGFRPLYAGQSGARGISGQYIDIEEIPGRSGYMLRQALLRDLSTGLPGIESGAILTISLDESVDRATLLPDGAVSRSFFNAEGSYVLTSSQGSIQGEAISQVPFAATESPYTDVSAQTYAAERAMHELSKKIVDQLRIQAQSRQ